MNTFSGKITKERFLEEIKKHRKADMLMQGTYGMEENGWKGCAVACSLRSLDIIQGKEIGKSYSEHERYESELGIPEWLARLEDTIFEGLPQKEAMKWPERFTQAIPVGISPEEMEKVKWKFTAMLMQENIERVEQLDISEELKKQVIDAIKQAQALNESSTEGERSAAESAAESARSAAESAAESARYAAWSAAWSARYATRSAWSAAESARYAAESADWSAAYIRYAKILVTLLQATGRHE